MIDPTTGSGAVAPPGMMTMTATSAATPAAKTSGLYVLPLGSDQPLRRGLNKVQFKATTPVMRKACEVVFGLLPLTGKLWDQLVVGPMNKAFKAKGMGNVYLPTTNFYADSRGMRKLIPASGYRWYARKGYDRATGIGYFWVVVS